MMFVGVCDNILKILELLFSHWDAEKRFHIKKVHTTATKRLCIMLRAVQSVSGK